MSAPTVRVPRSVISVTLAAFQKAGALRRECVVLWLGRRTHSEIAVVQAYVPAQVAEEDFFEIPRASMAALFQVLRDRELMVAAQVHTHPHEAFHSTADDRWAIVRHVGALSLVLPDFAQKTSVDSFLNEAAVFRLSDRNEWNLVDGAAITCRLQGAP
jgi:proteasome lid subunit RPN8/RPN11